MLLPVKSFSNCSDTLRMKRSFPSPMQVDWGQTGWAFMDLDTNTLQCEMISLFPPCPPAQASGCPLLGVPSLCPLGPRLLILQDCPVYARPPPPASTWVPSILYLSLSSIAEPCTPGPEFVSFSYHRVLKICLLVIVAKKKMLPSAPSMVYLMLSCGPGRNENKLLCSCDSSWFASVFCPSHHLLHLTVLQYGGAAACTTNRDG